MKKLLNLKHINEKWEKIAKHDLKARKVFYKDYSLKKSFKTYIDLLNLASKSVKNNMSNISSLKRRKSEELIRIHQIFNSVK